MLRVCVLILLLLPGWVAALEIEVKMLAQDSALLAIDGKQRMLRVGITSPEGVKLISADGKQAEVEINGQRETLTLTRRISTQFQKAEKAEVRIASGRGGHHFTPGRINGLPVEFMVDTGATDVAMNYLEAERLGIDYRAGTPIRVNTANGLAKAFQITLPKVSVGDIELYQVSANVNTTRSPDTILLGNSFLGRLDISIVDGVLILKEKGALSRKSSILTAPVVKKRQPAE